MEKKYISCADTAKIVREALKRHFPEIKFLVRSKTYSGGASITVSYTDNIQADKVRAITNRYEGASFDGMQDLKTYHSTLLADDDGNIKEVHFGADYIFVERHISDDIQLQAEKDLCEKYGLEWSKDAMIPKEIWEKWHTAGYICQEANSQLQKHDLTMGYNKAMLDMSHVYINQ